MDHVVFFPAADGSPAFARTASLESAVAMVEHLRNVESVSQVSVYALTEVPLAFRPYYRVELPGAEAEPASVAEVAPVTEPAAAAEPAAPAETLVPTQGAEPNSEPVELAAVAESVEPAPLALPAAEDIVPAARGEHRVPVEASNGHGDGARSLGFFAR